MKEQIKYQNWPERVKIITALSNKKFLLKNHKISYTLGWIVLILGVMELIYDVTQNRTDYTDLLNPLSLVLIGLVNLAAGNALKWIANNSSWEERFENSSTTLHKIISISMIIILFICLYMIIRFD